MLVSTIFAGAMASHPGNNKSFCQRATVSRFWRHIGDAGTAIDEETLERGLKDSKLALQRFC